MVLGILIGVVCVYFTIVWQTSLEDNHLLKAVNFQNEVDQISKLENPTEEELRKKELLEEQVQYEKVAGFFDLRSVVIVFGGSLAAALIAYPISRLFQSLGFIPQLFFFFLQSIFPFLQRTSSVRQLHISRHNLDREMEGVFYSVSGLAKIQYANEFVTDDDIVKVKNGYLRQWLQKFVAVDVVDENMIFKIISSEIKQSEERASEDIEVLEFIGQVAPAFGMTGSVIGLVLMLGQAQSAELGDVMAAMAVALVTTLYGVLLANLVFYPAATKREQLREAERVMLSMMRDGIMGLRRKISPSVLEDNLLTYLPLDMREKILASRQ